MNPYMPQQMMPYPYGIPQANQPQLIYPQYNPLFYPRYPNTNLIQPNPLPNFQNQQIVNQPQILNNQIQQNTETPESNEPQKPSEKMKILTKYKDIYVPSIFLLDYTDTSKPPYNLFIQSQQQQQMQQIPGQFMNNNQNNQLNIKYFNYGYNFEQWKKYVIDIKGKFDELNELVKQKKIILPEPDNELEYLMALPSDYGGLGDIQQDQKYSNVKFYDPKDTSKNPENKSFMEMIKFERDTTWFPLEPNQFSLNKPKINYININTSDNPMIMQNNFLNSNPNQSTIVSKSNENNNGNNSLIKESDDKEQNEKEKKEEKSDKDKSKENSEESSQSYSSRKRKKNRDRGKGKKERYRNERDKNRSKSRKKRRKSKSRSKNRERSRSESSSNKNYRSSSESYNNKKSEEKRYEDNEYYDDEEEKDINYKNYPNRDFKGRNYERKTYNNRDYNSRDRSHDSFSSKNDNDKGYFRGNYKRNNYYDRDRYNNRNDRFYNKGRRYSFRKRLKFSH